MKINWQIENEHEKKAFLIYSELVDRKGHLFRVVPQ